MAAEPSTNRVNASVKGQLDLLLLAILADGPLHGYGAIEALRARSGDRFDLPEGTVYPALHRLDRDGLLSSDWSDAGGRARRTYRITPRGRAQLIEKRAAWDELCTAIAAILEGTPWPTTSPRTTG